MEHIGLINGMNASEWSKQYCEGYHIPYCQNINNGTYAEFDGYGHHAICSKHHFDKVEKKMRNIKLF